MPFGEQHRDHERPPGRLARSRLGDARDHAPLRHAFGVTIPAAILAFIAAAAGGAGEAVALRQGFFWACLAMAGLALVGSALALNRPPSAPDRALTAELAATPRLI